MNTLSQQTIVTKKQSLRSKPYVEPLESGVVISVHNLSKMYPLYTKPGNRIKQLLWSALPEFLRGNRQFYQEHWALHNISFDVKQGETIGIIGHNGAGKSTLLQIIAGILKPTDGKVQLKGRVAALLELGSGFNPEFTGRENVYLSGAILGFNRLEMDTRFDDIVAFADIGGFIDQPVKLYSSGMFVRLAFAVQVCVEPDVLVIDEALAVGDIFFRQKCYQRLQAFHDEGRTVILVSHNMSEVEQFCRQALLLDQGKSIFYGNASEAVKHYYLLDQINYPEPAIPPQPAVADEIPPVMSTATEPILWPPADAFLNIAHIPQVSNGWARCTAVAVCDEYDRPCTSFQQGQTATFCYEFELLHDIEVPIGGVIIQDVKGIIVHGKNTLMHGTEVPLGVRQGSRLRFRQNITLEVGISEYTFQIGLSTINCHDYLHCKHYPHVELISRVTRLCHIAQAGYFTVGFRRDREPVQLLHHGITNLRGHCQVAVVEQ